VEIRVSNVSSSRAAHLHTKLDFYFRHTEAITGMGAKRKKETNKQNKTNELFEED